MAKCRIVDICCKISEVDTAERFGEGLNILGLCINKYIYDVKAKTSVMRAPLFSH